MVRARSIDGDLGIMPGHTPLLAILGEGEVVVKGIDAAGVTVTVDGGFLSVDRDQVRIVVDRVLTRSA
jgi:F-type H+-transporting ATPase subunit epsilon